MQWTRDEVLSKAVKFRKYCSSASKQVHFNQLKPVLEPMSCNQAQVQSGATRCNQVLSGVIRCHQVQSGAIRCNQVQSGAIRCNQVQVQSGSGAIRWACNQGPPGAFKFSAPETRSLCTALHWKSPLFPFFPLIKYVIKPFRRFSGPVLDTSFPSFAEKYHWQREREK